MVFKKPFQGAGKTKKNQSIFLIIGGVVLIGIVLGAVIWGLEGNLFDKIKLGENKNILTLEKGTTFIKADINGDWQIAGNDYELKEGNQVKTEKDALATITFKNENVVRLSGNTEITLETVPKDKNDINVTVKVTAGNIWSNVYLADDKTANFQVKTKNGIVKATGTIFNVSAISSLKTACYALEDPIDVRVIKKNKEINPTKLKEGYTTLIYLKKLPKKTTKSLTIKKINRKTLDGYWFKWNLKKDQEYYDKIGCKDKVNKEAPLYVYYPENGAKTTNESTTIKGSTELDAKVTINGTEVKNNKGVFTKKVNLKMGKNVYEIVVTTTANKTVSKTITVTRVENTKPDSISLTGSANSSGNHLSWGKSDDADFSFYKVLRSTTDSTPTYPTNNYVAVSNRESTAYTDYYVTKDVTYYYRIAIVDKAGQVGYSNIISLKAERESGGGVEGMSLSAYYSGGYVHCSWNAYSGSDFVYYKIAASSTNPYPSYPSPGSLVWCSGDRNTTSAAISTGSFSGCNIACVEEFHGWVYIRLVVLLDGGNKVHSNVVHLYIP